MEDISREVRVPAEHILNIFGQFDGHIKKLERQFKVAIVDRNGKITVSGNARAVERVTAIINELVELSERGNIIQEQNVDYAITMSMEENDDVLLEIDKDCICHTISGKPVKPKTLGQKQYVDAIRNNMIVFGLGPAGTGKTYLAMAMAVESLLKEECNRIILTRPAKEAGENLVFLPGSLEEKIMPYLRPLYDALYDMLTMEEANDLISRNVIEVAPLAFMRGRTLNNSFIILDEAQNTTKEQMLMFLTRLGYNSRCVITGDPQQTDIGPREVSGLLHAEQVLSAIPEIAFCHFGTCDVVRHALLEKIINAYAVAGKSQPTSASSAKESSDREPE